MLKPPRHLPRLAAILLLIATLLAAWAAWGPAAQSDSLAVRDGDVQTLSLAGESFTVELATTPASRQRGLMHRQALPADRGMLFIFPDEAPRTFWMKQVRFAIDILYLDTDWRIVHVIAGAPPCMDTPCETYPSQRPARYVLELPAGTSARLGMQPGQQLSPPKNPS